MTQSKRRSPRKPVDGAKIVHNPDGPLWLAVDQLDKLGIDPATANVEQIVADAKAVDGWVVATNSAHHGELVGHATGAWPSGEAVDRLNAALALLEAAGRVYRIG